MKVCGRLCGIGIGPGDSELITLKGVKLLGCAKHLVVPKSRLSSNSLAFEIVKPHLNPSAKVHEVIFPMTSQAEAQRAGWAKAASEVFAILSSGEDVCFPTLGDPFLYSTYIYLVRVLREMEPDLSVITIPGVNSFSAASAKAEFSLGEGGQTVTIVPATGSLSELRGALAKGGTTVIMKIGGRLSSVIELLEEFGAMEASVFFSHLGMENEMVETDLNRLKDRGQETGYLSIILTKT
ncbi:MAG: precorrin-2 C(20)-methyltransferase [Actinomycetota bacterium]|nr:precorrin-2 C(20)-methyltransferase [Actinomycetota bacterium]